MGLPQPLADRKQFDFLLACLDPKQQIYVESRSKGSVPVAAARMAGFKDPDEAALRLEKDLTVRTAIEHGLRVASHAASITRTEVINMLKDAFHLASTSAEMTAAAREIGKIIGAYAPTRVETTHNVKVTQEQIKDMSDEDLSKLAIDGEFSVVPEEGADAPVPQETGSN